MTNTIIKAASKKAASKAAAKKAAAKTVSEKAVDGVNSVINQDEIKILKALDASKVKETLDDNIADKVRELYYYLESQGISLEGLKTLNKLNTTLIRSHSDYKKSKPSASTLAKREFKEALLNRVLTRNRVLIEAKRLLFDHIIDGKQVEALFNGKDFLTEDLQKSFNSDQLKKALSFATFKRVVNHEKHTTNKVGAEMLEDWNLNRIKLKNLIYYITRISCLSDKDFIELTSK